MFLAFLDALRAAGISAGLKEHLVLLEALDREVIGRDPEQFYYLARATYVKDESLIDRFDRVFAQVFKGVLADKGDGTADLPEEWLRKIAELHLRPEQMAKIEGLGSWDEIMATLRRRLAEQEGRHQGGSKWIGTGGTSPFGNAGYNPEGVRIGGESRHKRAIKVWERREFANLDAGREIGTRNIKVALRRLRRFAREGAADELDLEATIDGTAQGLARRRDAAGAAQCRQAASVPRCRRIDGPTCAAMRGAVLGGERGVQEPRVLLLSQLHLRRRVEGQLPPLCRANADLGHPP